MYNILKYQQSIAAEFEAQKDRVRFFIDNNHWGEDGRYKEIILSNFLRSLVPGDVEVGTGFVRNADGELTTQIDIIIYKKNYPTLFRQGDFVVLMPESVLGIIEVKSTTTHSILTSKSRKGLSVIEKSERNGKIIGSQTIFNGIWGYDTEIEINQDVLNTKLGKQLYNCQGYLNHICFDSNIFCRYWENGNPSDRHYDDRRCFSFYNLSWNKIFDRQDNNKAGLAFGYFISNLLEYIYRQIAPQVLNDQYFEFLYPITNTKEDYRYNDCDIKIN